MVRTVENLLYLLRRWVVCLRGDFFLLGRDPTGEWSVIRVASMQKECEGRFQMNTQSFKRF